MSWIRPWLQCRLWLLTIVVGFALSAVVRAKPAELRVAVFPVVYDGELDKPWRTEIEARLLDGLTRGQLVAVPPAEVAALEGFDPACVTAECVARIADATRTRYLVRTRVARDDRDYRVSIELVDPGDGSVVASTGEACNLCGAVEVGEVVEVQAAALRKKVDALAIGPPILLLESTPPGATAVLDGEIIGTTPLRYEVAPGHHVVELSRDGSVPQQRSFEAVAGVQERMSVAMQDAPRTWKPAARKWGWAALAVGGGATVSGIVLLAIDERPYQGRCSGVDIDAFGNCRFTYDTMAGGIAAVVTGAALVATGVALLVAARKRGGKSSRAARRVGMPTWGRVTR